MMRARAKKLTDQDRRGLTALFCSDISARPVLLQPVRRAGLGPLHGAYGSNEREEDSEKG